MPSQGVRENENSLAGREDRTPEQVFMNSPGWNTLYRTLAESLVQGRSVQHPYHA
jgi:hypothetical protein